MTDKSPSAQAFRVSELSAHRETRFDLRLDAETMKAIAVQLDLLDLRKLSFAGFIRAEGKRDWYLEARLGATVTQPCVVTLAPVVSRIEETVERRFLHSLPDLSGTEDVELPEDDSIEELGSHIAPHSVMVEALALALPLYPRAEGASLGSATYTEPGVAPLSEETRRPFAGLAELREKMNKKE